MDEESQPTLFQSTTQPPSSGGSYWLVAIPIVLVIAVATYVIILAASFGEHQEGALNGLGSLIAGVLAVGALIGGTALAVFVRLISR